MPYDLVLCPSCESEVPDGVYCKSCGQQLHVDDTSDAETEVEELTSSELADKRPDSVQSVPDEPGEQMIPIFSFSIKKMNDRSAAILFSGAELEVLNKELDVLIEKIRATRHALDLEHSDKDLLATRALELRDSFDKSKQRRDELNQVAGVLKLRSILDELETCEVKISKLDEIEKTLDPDVYEEERTTLANQLKDLQKELKSSTKSAKQWIKGIEQKLKELGRELSRLDAKLKIGDISVSAFDDKKYQAERSIDIIEKGRLILTELIKSAKEK
ncbi:MAG: hypothetical protein ACTSUB_01990 [Candidatus Thorarchaeota archaeon]